MPVQVVEGVRDAVRWGAAHGLVRVAIRVRARAGDAAAVTPGAAR